MANIFETLSLADITDDMNGASFYRYILEHPCCVMWRLERNDKGNLTKTPYQTNGYKASPTNSRNWTTLDKALEALSTGQFNGVGIVLTKEDPFVFVDVDHCIDDEGKLSSLAAEILTALGTGPDVYRELSQSGHGLHFIVTASIPEVERNGTQKSGGYKNSPIGLEIYDRERYCALTGNVFEEEFRDE